MSYLNKTMAEYCRVVPNPPLKSDPACIAFRSLSAICYPGSAHRQGAGAAA